jgi:hypothetical protein
MEKEVEQSGPAPVAMDAIVIPNRVHAGLPAVPVRRPSSSPPFQFSIDTVLLITTALAISLAAMVAVPAIGGVVFIFSLLVLVRTVVRTTRQAHANPMITLDDKIFAYGDSLIATFVASFAFFIVVFAGSVLTAAVTGAANAMFGAQPRFTLLELIVQSWAILLGLAGLLATGLGGAAAFWSFYWKTLPPITAVASRDETAKRIPA